ncbi:MAG: hypothetical protein UGF89_10305 [Acutalibacteraceae bacterium]|nr:hypothetical protein [Acutalibacteraceae bacterium]
MKNKKGTIILSIILAVQFIIPLSVWGYETYKNKELDEKGQEVKIFVDWVNYEERIIEFHINNEEEILYDDNKYIVFENGEDGFSTPKTVASIPSTDLYITQNKLYSWYRPNWCFEYESEITKAQDEYDYFELYNGEIEKENIEQGYSNGPQTKAYAVFKVYKNRFKVVNVYIEEMPVDTVIEKYNNNEWDNSRYEYQYDDYDEIVEEIYDAVIEEYVTEPVAA